MSENTPADVPALALGPIHTLSVRIRIACVRSLK